MFKKLILALLSRAFGLKISEEQLNVFIALIQTLIETFGGAASAAVYAKQLNRQAMFAGPDKAKEALQALHKTLGEQ